MEIWYPTGSIIISVCLDLLGSTRRRYYSGKRGQDFCKDTKKQQNSGGGRGASWVKSVGSCRLHHSKGTCISTQYPNCQLHHTQRHAARLAVGHSLCVSAPNTLPSQPSSQVATRCAKPAGGLCFAQTKWRPARQYSRGLHEKIITACFSLVTLSVLLRASITFPTRVMQLLSLSLAGGYYAVISLSQGGTAWLFLQHNLWTTATPRRDLIHTWKKAPRFFGVFGTFTK